MKSINELMKDTRAGIEDLIPAAITMTVLIVLFAIIPVIGYNIDASWTPPSAGAAGVQWNTGIVNGTMSMTNGSELWATNSPLMALAVLIGIIFTAIGMLLKGGGKIGGGGM